MLTETEQKGAHIFYCNKCDYKCCKKTNWVRHISTLKHKNVDECLQNVDAKGAGEVATQTKYICVCGKSFSYRQSIHVHKKKCATYKKPEPEYHHDHVSKISESSQDIANLTQLVFEVVKNSSDIQKQTTDIQKQMLEIVKNNHTSVTNNNIINSHKNSHNKTFNLQVFLNETCKDAMNINDFVNSLQIQLSDLENVGRNGFVNGITNIIMKNLKALDYTQRPIHCSDKKREIVYIKCDNQWINDTKESPENQKLKQVIKQIAHKNICMIQQWKAKYPDYKYAESSKSDLYNKIVYESMDHNERNSEKIINKLVKEIAIIK